MIIRKTSALVESGILAAIATVFTIIGAYVPILSLIANFVWPLPIILCGRRHGLKWSFLCLMVAGIIAAVLVSPIHALSVVAVFGIIGLTMGECMRRQLSPLKLMLIGSIGAVISFIISMLIGYLIMHINVMEVFLDSMNQGFTMSVDFYRQMGYGPEQIAQITEEMKIMKEMVVMILPVAFIMVAPFTVFVNYWAARKILAKMGDYYPWFPPFAQWSMPRYTLLPYGVSLILLMQFNTRHEHTMYQVAFNIFVFCNVLLVVQSLALIYWYINTKGKPRWWFSVCFTVIFISQFMSQIAVLLGAYDLVFDFRHRKPKIKKDVQ